MINNSLQKQRKHSSSGGRLFQAGKLIALLMLLCTFVKVTKADELTVYNGTTTSYYAPMYVFYFDEWAKTQFVIPSSELTSMAGGSITELKFYTTSSYIPYTTVSSFVFYMKEVDYTSISSYEPQANAQQVYSGYGSFVSVSGGGTITITFDTPYVYHGGNLLIGCENITRVGWKGIKFYGQSVTGASISGSNGSSPSSAPATQQNFIPKTTFIYTLPAEIVATTATFDMGERPNDAWMRPEAFTLSNVGDQTAEITSIVSDNNYFVIDAELPIYLDGGETVDIAVMTTTATAGLVEGQITVTYNDPDEEKTTTMDISAVAYDPVEGDVWENPVDLGDAGVGLSTMQSFSDELHKNYVVPDASYATVNYDKVVKVNFTEDVVITCSMYLPTDWEYTAVYRAEDFVGVGGPDADNALLVNPVDVFLAEGEYYIVGGTFDNTSYFMIYTSAVPEPEPTVITYPYEGATNVDNGDFMEFDFGTYTKEMQVFIGTQYPPTTMLLDWTTDLTTPVEITGLNHNTVYFAQVKTRNNSGTVNSDIVPFTTVIDPIEDFAAVEENIFVGDGAVFTWTPANRAFLGYNIYQDGVKLNDELLTATTYTVEDLAYNMGGYTFNVTAVHEAGESAYSDDVEVRVSGNTGVLGHVYEQDGTTPINNIVVTFIGEDEFGNDVENVFTTDEEGYYEGNMKAGIYYYLMAEGEGYQTYERYLSWYLPYDMSYLINICMHEIYYPVASVTAVEEGDNVRVDWVQETRAFQNYKVYRTLNSNEGPYTEENTVLIAETTDLTALDETWTETEDGVLYKYGVGSVYSGNRDQTTLPTTLSEGFDNGFPEGWTKLKDYGYDWMLGSEAGLGYGKGHNGSHDMMVSKGYVNGQVISHDNYLVTPKVAITSTSKFSFWACAQDENYHAEQFGVCLSTTTNDNTGDFFQIASWQMTAKGQGNWYQYTVDLSAYAGREAYLAIRHWDWYSDVFYLDVDDIELTAEGESAIVWSNPIGKDMYIAEGVSVLIDLNNWNESPVGAVISFENNVEYEQETYPIADVTITEDMIIDDYDTINDIHHYFGYYEYTDFRKGEYTLTITKANYNKVITNVNVIEAYPFVYTLYETLATPDVLVSSTGFATWVNKVDQGDRALVNYSLGLYSANWGYTYYYEEGYTNDCIQLPVDGLTEGEGYWFQLGVHYTSGSNYTNTYFTYSSCDNYEGVNNLTLASSSEGNSLSWEYPEIDENYVWVFDGTKYASSGYQIAVATDDENIYTSSWSSNAGFMFAKYDLQGNFIKTFDIEGCGYIRDLTYDGQYFYGGANGSVLYCVDLANETLISTIATPCSAIRHCSYDPENDGFWIGTYTNLMLISRTGELMNSIVSIPTTYGTGYYTDEEGNAHLLLNTGGAKVYDYDIANSEYDVLFELNNPNSNNPGGAFCGEYYGELAYFGSIQQSPNLYNVYRRVLFAPEGVVVFRDNEPIGFTDETSFVDEGVMDNHNYTVRVVYPGYVMSCLQGVSVAYQNATMTAGWNWWSAYIEQDEDFGGLGILESGLGENGVMIKSQNGFVTYDEASGEWSGTLTDIDNESMYKVKTTEAAEFSMYGTVADPAQHPITLGTGWSWIGYPVNYNMDVNAALAGLEAADGDMIKSQYGFATYYEETGWFGSLNTLYAGMGYMYLSNNDDDVTFVYGEENKEALKENVVSEHWMANYNAYANNMTVMAVVELNDIEVAGDYELAAFANGECRGAVKLIPVKNRYMAFLTVAGDEAAELRFALYNANTEEEIFESNNVISFNNNATVGDIDNPYVVSFRGTTSVDEISGNMTVYPNPVMKGGNVTITLAESTETMQVEVYNTLGELIYVEKFGQSQANITMPETTGVYVVRIVTGNNNTMFRKVVVE